MDTLRPFVHQLLKLGAKDFAGIDRTPCVQIVIGKADHGSFPAGWFEIEGCHGTVVHRCGVHSADIERKFGKRLGHALLREASDGPQIVAKPFAAEGFHVAPAVHEVAGQLEVGRRIAAEGPAVLQMTHAGVH